MRTSACKGAAFRSSIAALGVQVIPGDPTYHCPRAERAIQEIKHMAARIRATLVWKLETDIIFNMLCNAHLTHNV